MIKCNSFPEKEFKDKEELHAYVKANRNTLLASKKASVKTHANSRVLGFLDKKTGTVKGIPNMEEGYIYPVISNTNWFDNHEDVHVNGSMTKTAKEQNGKTYYVADHTLEIDQVIAAPEDVEVKMMVLSWVDLGKNYEGSTEAMVFKIAKDKIMHDKFLKMIDRGIPLQNSIRMEYVKLEVAINSDRDDYTEEKKVWDEIYPLIANKDEVDKYGFFYAVKELKIRMEGSAVLFGSNEATPISKINEAEQSLQEPEPEKSTQKEKVNLIDLISKTQFIKN